MSREGLAESSPQQNKPQLVDRRTDRAAAAPAYHGTKHAVMGMTKSAGWNMLRAASVSMQSAPWTIETPMGAEMLEGQAEAMAEIMKQQSIGRLGRPEEVAAAVLCSLRCRGGAAGRRRLHRALRTRRGEVRLSGIVEVRSRRSS
jgi:NAD(P)-dependent dehydrogenase (short-subunit alcohol dehydrogenase family)